MPPLSRITWWSLSDCDLILERSALEPPTQYCKIDVSKWVSEAIQHSQELPDTISWQSNKSDVVYLGQFRSPTDSRPSQPAPIFQKHEPVTSNSGSATKRRIRRGRARHLKSDRDIERIAETSTTSTQCPQSFRRESRADGSRISQKGKGFTTLLSQWLICLKNLNSY